MGKYVGPSRTDLFKVLNEYARDEHLGDSELDAAEKAAQDAFDKFTETNPEYLALEKACSIAHSKAYEARRKIQESRRKEIRECSNHIRLKGVDAEIIKRIEKLVSK